MVEVYDGPIFDDEGRESECLKNEHVWYHLKCNCCGNFLETDDIGSVACPDKDNLNDIAYDEDWVVIGDVHICKKCQNDIEMGIIKVNFEK